MKHLDFVCKMHVEEENAVKYEWNGKTYYFCSEDCKEAFAHNPEKYVEK
ncbi:MAG: YHS domain-containing protein [Brevinematia bacterium]